MKITLDKIDISDKVKDFAQYLETTDRIILSAKFGDGKTYLLNELRKDTALKEEYEFFTIYPVNYSVAKNEDVFEYIKKDIIKQLQEREFLDKIDMEALFDSVFNFDDLASIVSFLLSFVPMGIFYNKVFNKFCEKKKLYEERKHTADKYLEKFVNTAGCIYEEDGYTRLIRKAIEWISQDHFLNDGEWKEKKPVLLIEDLDRLDPKHLFRILNVVSAHIDDKDKPDTVGNKFGFHNIILVMDYDITRHIFHHFYGNQACYEGYMSKFLSREPFRYSIRTYMIRAIEWQLGIMLGIQKVLPYLMNFKKRLLECSLRDLYKLIQLDTEGYIKHREYIYYNGKIPISLPLFHLIIYMMECGMSVEEIQEDLLPSNKDDLKNFRENETDFIKLLYPVYITHFPGMQYIKGDNMTYHLSLVKSEDSSEVIITPAESWGGVFLLPMKVDSFEMVILALLKALSYSMNLSALRLS